MFNIVVVTLLGILIVVAASITERYTQKRESWNEAMTRVPDLMDHYGYNNR